MLSKAKDFLATSRGQRAAKWLLGVPLVISILGFLIFPPIVRYVAQDQLTKTLGRETTLGKVRFNPWTLALQIDDFKIKDAEGGDAFVSFKSLLVDLETLSLIKLAPVVRQVALTDPYVHIMRLDADRFNFSDIVERLSKDSKPAEPDAEPLRYSINNVTLTNGKVEFKDRQRETHSLVEEINIGVPFISNLPANVEIDVLPSFAARLDGAPLVLKGKTKPFTNSQETALEVNIDDLVLPPYQKYAPEDLAFNLASGKLATQLTLTFQQSKDRKPKLTVTGTAALKELEITDTVKQTIFKLPLFEADVGSADVFDTNFKFKRIAINAPELHVSRDSSGVINLLKLVPKSDGGKADASGAEKNDAKATLAFVVDETQLKGGRIVWKDDIPKPSFATELKAIDLTVKGLTNVQGQSATVDLSVSTEHDETLKHEGKLALTPLAAEGSVTLDTLNTSNYLAYIQNHLPFELKEGRVLIKSGYSVQQADKDMAVRVKDLDVTVNDVKLHQGGAEHDFFLLPELHLTGGAVDVSGRTVTIGHIGSHDGKIEIRRDKNGIVDLSALSGTKSAPGGAAETVAKPTAGAATTTDVGAAESKGSPWTVNVTKLDLQKFGLTLQDQATSKATTTVVNPVDVSVQNFSTSKDAQPEIKVQLGVNKKGLLAVDGPLKLQPLGGKLKVNVKDLDLAPFRYYLPENVKLVLASGIVNVDGTATMETNPEGAIKAGYNGNVALSKFATQERSGNKDLLKWKALTLSGLDYQTAPTSLALKLVKLDGLNASVRMAKDGTVNVTSLTDDKPAASRTDTAPESSPGAAKQPASNPANIRIDAIKINDGTVLMVDERVTPNYSSKLTAINGKVEKLSSAKTDPTGLQVKAMLNGHSALDINGKINPFGKDLFADIKVVCKDLDVNAFSPYTRRYVGYPLQQGKLSLDLEYAVDKRNLQAKNKVFFDHLALGSKESNPEALSLPLELAVTLLTDRKGQINLDLPVEGSLDDPKFSVFGVVIDVLVNLITKAATAPFSLLSSAFGGGDDLGSVVFDAGQPVLNAAAQEKLTKLGQALQDRTELKIEVVSEVDPAKDRPGARDYHINQQALEQKRAEMKDEGTPDDKLQDIKIGDDEYEKYLALAYDEADFKKPRNAIGMAKKLPKDEMEKLMRDNTTISDADLQQLGKRRAEAIRDFLVKQNVETGRIFIAEPVFKPGDDKASGGRVSFVIK